MTVGLHLDRFSKKKKEKVKVSPHPTYSHDLVSHDFILFPRLKKCLSGRRYGSVRALGSRMYLYLIGIPIKDYETAFQKFNGRIVYIK